MNSRIFPEYRILLQNIVFRRFQSIQQCIAIIDVYINSGINALLWSLADHHFMLFLYDKEDILAYCCHAEEPINFQSFFFPIKTNKKRNTRVLREISNLALSCIAYKCAYSVPSYYLYTPYHPYHHTPAFTRSCTLFAVCTVHLLLSEQCAINYIHMKTTQKQCILTNLYYSDFIIWN